MTREEAINHLITVRNTCIASGYDSAVKDACDMAIKALEQEPIDRIEYGTDGNAYRLWISNGKEYEPSGDLISRQAVMDALCDGCELFKNGEQTCFSKCEEYHFLATLPSVKQERTGHWVGIDEYPHEDYECDHCGFIHTFIDGHTAQYNYCPHCGAKMEGEDEEC